jgi:hypothetical protein
LAGRHCGSQRLALLTLTILNENVLGGHPEPLRDSGGRRDRRRRRPGTGLVHPRQLAFVLGRLDARTRRWVKATHPRTSQTATNPPPLSGPAPA